MSTFPKKPDLWPRQSIAPSAHATPSASGRILSTRTGSRSHKKIELSCTTALHYQSGWEAVAFDQQQSARCSSTPSTMWLHSSWQQNGPGVCGPRWTQSSAPAPSMPTMRRPGGTPSTPLGVALRWLSGQSGAESNKPAKTPSSPLASPRHPPTPSSTPARAPSDTRLRSCTGKSSKRSGRTGDWGSTRAPVNSRATTRGAEPSSERRKTRSRSSSSLARRRDTAASPHESTTLQSRTRSGYRRAV